MIEDYIFSGDSHCQIFHDLVHYEAGITYRCKAARSTNSDGFFAANFASKSGKDVTIDPGLVAAIDALSMGQENRPMIVVTLGGSDVMTMLAWQDWKEYDFYMVNMASYTNFEKICLPFSIVDSWIKERFFYVRDGLKIISQRYPGRLAILSPPPPHRAEHQIHQFLTQAGLKTDLLPDFRFRAKLYQLIHKELQASCIDAGVKFVNTWSFSEENHALKTEFEFDGFHVNEYYARTCLPVIANSAGHPRPSIDLAPKRSFGLFGIAKLFDRVFS